MGDFLQRLKQRKLVQWALAYVAGAWVMLQVLSLAAGSYHWPDAVMHIAFGVLALGFVVTLVLAWYHGERGVQRINGVELLIIALVLAVGGGVLWNFARAPSTATASTAIASTSGPDATRSPDAAQRNPGNTILTSATAARKSPDFAAVAASSGLRIASVPIANQPIPAKSIAVLPFESLSADKNNAFFADGMQDLILTKLADIGDLKVIARTSTMQYGSHPQNLTLVGQQLGVATILEGSVQKSGKQVLINVQLIDVKTDSHIWAESYTRTLDNIFGVEGEVAAKVANALNAKLTAQETAAVTRVPTTNPQAYVLYLKAQRGISMIFSATSGTAGALALKAADYLRQAIALDPNFAAAYGNLALLELNLTPRGKRVSTQPWMTHARKALSLQPDSPMALLTIGRWQFYHGHAGPGLQALQKAARLAPGNAFVVNALSNIYQLTGEWQQADAVARQAVRVDPRNADNYFIAANTSLALRHYADARQMVERGLAVGPDNPYLRAEMGQVLGLLGDFAGARAEYAQLPAGRDFGKFRALAALWLSSRNCTEALKAAKHVPPLPKSAGFRVEPQLLIGRCELMLGDQASGRATLTQTRTSIETLLQKHPHGAKELGDQARLQNGLAYIEAWLGNRDAALQAVSTAIALEARRYAELWKQYGLPQTSKGLRIITANYAETKAEILAHFGDAKGATDILRWLLPTPGIYNSTSPALLRLDPIWDPIRHDPRFQALLKLYSGDTSAPAQSASGSTTLTKGKR